ncbi:MAG: SDR family NAD(P)-dependent oxidoreductase [Hyphomicrobiaceae bacterium]
MDIAFEGQTVVVTGVARGIGRAIAQGFAERGAHVQALDILPEGLAECARDVAPARGGSVTTHQVDLADAAAVTTTMRKIEARGRAVDVLVHAAGGIRGRSKATIENVSDDDWRAIMDANVTAAFHLARAAAPAMKVAGKGRFIAISSQAGLGVSLTGIQAYGTAKAAEIGFVKQLAAELGAFGITVNSVAPGFMPTSPDYVKQWEGYSAERQQQIVESIALKRIGKPQDIAHAVMFLASEYAGFITGQTLLVKGGP